MSVPTLFRNRARRGVAAVELAVIAPVLILMVYGVIDFSRGYFLQSAISGAVRDGARFAAQLETPAGSERQQVRNRVRAFLTNALPGSTIADSLIIVAPTDSTADSVSVTIRNYPVRMFTGIRYLIGLSGRNTTITRSATFRHETIR